MYPYLVGRASISLQGKKKDRVRLSISGVNIPGGCSQQTAEAVWEGMHDIPDPMTDFQLLVKAELARARDGHGSMQSLHEAYAVILEEVDEFKEEVWKKARDRDRANILSELVQIAAMAQKTAEDLKLL